MKNPFSNLFKKNKKGADAIAPDTGSKPKKKGFLENFFKNRMGKKAAQGEDVVGVELTPEEIRLAQLTSNKSNFCGFQILYQIFIKAPIIYFYN